MQRAAGGAVAGAALTAGMVGTAGSFGVGTANAAPLPSIVTDAPGQIGNLVGNGIAIPTGVDFIAGLLPPPYDTVIPLILPTSIPTTPGGAATLVSFGNTVGGSP
jgi:hypothetical protein